MISDRRLEPYIPDNIEVDIEEYEKLKEDKELYENVLYKIKETIKGWQEEGIDDWENILSEIQWLFEYYEVDVC